MFQNINLLPIFCACITNNDQKSTFVNVKCLFTSLLVDSTADVSISID